MGGQRTLICKDDQTALHEDELGNEKFYQEVENDLSKEIKAKNDTIVDIMICKDEIPV